jgi:hypothetical protein
MPTPSKPIALIKQEGNRRRLSKKAIEHREKMENQLFTGVELKASEEVLNNTEAYKEFKRLKPLLKAINKDDELIGYIINQHCLLVSECFDLTTQRKTFLDNLEKFEDRIIDEEITFTDKMKIKMGIQKQILDCDKALMNKRKMLFDIAKENIMTIAGALRSIPKKPQEDEQIDNLSNLLSGGRPGR